jgi:hypothetical protein
MLFRITAQRNKQLIPTTYKLHGSKLCIGDANNCIEINYPETGTSKILLIKEIRC